MALADDLQNEVAEIFESQWTSKNGTVVPTDNSVTLKNDGIKIDACVLYADLDASTDLVDTKTQTFAAEVYKSFLWCAAKIIRDHAGEITAYDGDRIMAIFIGGAKNTAAAKTALKINYACKKIINPAIAAVYGADRYTLGHVVGVDRSELLVAKTGVRGANDLVWVGKAANHAAKLCTLPADYPSWITGTVYDGMLDEAKISTDGRPMWEKRIWTAMEKRVIYRSAWTWTV